MIDRGRLGTVIWSAVVQRKPRPNYGRRMVVVTTLMMAGFVGVLARGIYLTVDPANRTRANLTIMTRQPVSLNLLTAQADKIKDVAAHIDSHTLGEITGLLTDTSAIAGTASVELQAQSDAWSKIRANAAMDAQAYLDVQRKLAATNKLQAEEILRLNDVLNKALEPSWSSSLMTGIVSFIGGVVMTLASDLLQKKLKDWGRQVRGWWSSRSPKC